jgi:hypothetical protein
MKANTNSFRRRAKQVGLDYQVLSASPIMVKNQNATNLLLGRQPMKWQQPFTRVQGTDVMLG